MCLNPLLESNALLFCCSLFFKEYCNMQIRINKMVNEESVDYHLSPLRLISKIHLSGFFCPLRALSFSEIFFEFALKSVYPTMVREHIQICGVQINRKCICQNFHQGSYHHPAVTKKLRIPPRSVFRKSILQTECGGLRTPVK